jgi:hypothetical protein
LFFILIAPEDYTYYLLYFIKISREIVDNIIQIIKQQNSLYFIARKLILYLMYIVLKLISYFIKRFAISFIIFNLYIKYNNIVLHYIYNSLNIKDCIVALICK